MKKINLLPLLLLITTFFIGEGLFSNSWGSDKKSDILRKGLYTLRKTPEPKIFITGIDADKIMQRLLPNFNKIGEQIMWKWGRKHKYFNGDTKEKIVIRVAVYPTVQYAEENVLDLLNDASGISNPGTDSKVDIGNNSWHYKSGDAGTVTFLRKNVLIGVFSNLYPLAERIAKEIDKSLIKGGKGIGTGKKVDAPIIHEILAPSSIEKGEKHTIIIRATDPNEKKLTYLKSSDKGRFLFSESPHKIIYQPTKVGTNKILVCVINESNVVSEVKEVEIIVK